MKTLWTTIPVMVEESIGEAMEEGLVLRREVTVMNLVYSFLELGIGLIKLARIVSAYQP